MEDAKTSQSHPLIIQPVAIPNSSGVIGLTFCPGKKYVSEHYGEWKRDIRTDLQVVQKFGAKALVTLMESDELDEVKVPVELLREQAREFGLEWHHLPVKGVDIPDDRFEDLWTYSGLRLRDILAQGNKIVLHCLGGIGRTGTVAGRLLVEFGDKPETAIKKIGAARKGCIETFPQENYVKNCRPVASARVQRSREERMLACLLGGAIGDALGYEVEFDNLRTIRERFGEDGIKAPVLHRGKLIVSDDTQMTLFTLEGLLRALKERRAQPESPIAFIRQAYLDWFDTQGHAVGPGGHHTTGWLVHQTEMRVQRAPGSTCLSGLRSGGHGTIAKPINDSKGCGGAMRVAPIGLIGPGDDAPSCFRLAAEAAALTHGHPSGYLSAGMVAAILSLLMHGIKLHTKARGPNGHGAIEQSCELLSTYAGHEETLAAVNRAVALAAKGSKDHATAVEALGGGWVGQEALAIALYAALSANSFVEAVLIGTNHSGDSDSTAAIAGQLWGATNGLEGIPHDWVANLDVLVPLLHLARQLIACSLG